MRVGVKILDDGKFRKVLDDGFGRLGYALANSDVDQRLYCAHYSHLTPRGRGRAYLLKFTHPPGGDWNAAHLQNAETGELLNTCFLKPPVRVQNEKEKLETRRVDPGAAIGDSVEDASGQRYLDWAEDVVATFTHVILGGSQGNDEMRNL